MKELNDKEEMELNGLIGNLKTHEMERKAEEEKVPQKKKTLSNPLLPSPMTIMKTKKMMKIYPFL